MADRINFDPTGARPIEGRIDFDPTGAQEVRDLGTMETAGRTVMQAVRTALGLWDALALGLASKFSLDEADRVGRMAQSRDQMLRERYDFKSSENPSLLGQVAGGLASVPVEILGGMGVQHGFERGREVIDRGGALEEAGRAGVVSGAGNVALNLLPAAAGLRAAERSGLGRAGRTAVGATTGAAINVPAEIGLAFAENAALPDRPEFKDLERDPFDTGELAVSGGLAAGIGALAGGMTRGRGGRPARRSKGAASDFDMAAEKYGFEAVKDDEGRTVYRTPSGAYVTPEDWENASDRRKKMLVKPAKPSEDGAGPAAPGPTPEQQDRLLEIERLRAESSPEVQKVLDEERAKIEKEIEEQIQQAQAQRRAADLERAASATADKGLQAALRAAAAKIAKPEPIPVPEAKEITDAPPTGRAPDIEKLPVPEAKEVVDQPAKDEKIPVPESKELTPDEADALKIAPKNPAPWDRWEREAAPKAKKKKATKSNRHPVLRIIAKAGGISTKLASDVSGERSFRANSGVLSGLFRKRGAMEDRLAEILHEAGYISDIDVRNGDAERVAIDIVQRVARGENVLPVGEIDETPFIQRINDEIIEEAERRGIETKDRTIEEIEDALRKDDELRWRLQYGVLGNDDMERARHTRLAAEIDEGAVERAAIQFEDDDVGFDMAIARILGEIDEGDRVGESSASYAGQASDARTEPLEARREQPGRDGASARGKGQENRQAATAAQVGGKDAAGQVTKQAGVQQERQQGDARRQAPETGAGDRVQRATRSQEESAAQEAREVGERKRTPQPGQQDLFADWEAPAGRGRQLAPREVEINAAPGAVDAAKTRDSLKTYGRQVGNVTVGKLKLPDRPVRTPMEAAQAMAPMRRDTQEQVLALVTDQNDKPLALIRHSKGGPAQSQVFADALAGAIFNVKGAKNVWFAHNHPSGVTKESDADMRLTETLGRLMRGTGVEPKGMVILAPGGRANFITGKPSETAGDMAIKPSLRKAEVPVKETRFTQFTGKTGPKIETPADLKAAMDQIPGNSGVLLMDHQLNVVGALEMPVSEMAKLRTGDPSTGAGRILQAMGRVNATNVAVKVPGGEVGLDAARNVGTMMDGYGARILDIVHGGISLVNVGDSLANPRGEFYSLEGPVWHSPLVRFIEGLNQNKAPAKDWKNLINSLKQKGIKEDEIEWSGVREWLDLQNGSVTKEQVLEYLRQGGVQINEVVLGRADEKTIRNYAAQNIRETIEAGAVWDADAELALERWRNAPINTTISRQSASLLNKKLREAGDLRSVNDYIDPADAEADNSKYSKHVIPGGSNYREVLLTLPSMTGKQAIGRRAVFDKYLPEINRIRAMQDAMLKGPVRQLDMREVQALDDQLDAVIEKRDREAASVAGEMPEYKSPHWDEPNVLAHIRVDDRTDADGNRVLFVQEIQSDWGQEGKKRGFKADAAEAAAIKAEYDAAAQAVQDAHNGDRSKLEDARRRLAAAIDAYNARINDATIPVAPFVNATDKWVALAIKRVLKMAADGGYDKVAFITGEQAAGLYDLSKHIKRIEYADNGNNRFHIGAFDNNGRIAINKTVDANELPNLVGKEVAQKIVNDEGAAEGAKQSGHKVLSGLDLKVGGEGMRFFYDKIVPKVANDILKKLGGDGLITSRIKFEDGARDQLAFDITPKMREALQGGAPMFSRDDGKQTPKAGSPVGSPGRLDRVLRDKFGDKLIDGLLAQGILKYARGADEPVPPRARAVMRQGERGEGPSATLYWDRIRAEDAPGILMHELGEHFGIIRLLGEERYAKLLEDLRGMRDDPEVTKVWERVARNYRTQDGKPMFKEGDERFMREVAAHLVEDAPNLPWVRKLINAIRAALYEIGLPAGKVDANLLRGLAASALRKASQGDLMAMREPVWQRQMAGMDDYSMTGANGPRVLDEETTAELLTRKFLDRFNRVVKAQELAGDVASEADIVQADRLYHGRVQYLGEKLNRDFIEPLGELLSKAKELGVSVKDADDFLMALHAPERNRVIAARNPKMPDGGSGLTNQQAREIIESFEPEQRRVLDQVAKLVHKMNREKLDLMVDGGLITPETRDTLNRQYRYYVPLKSLDEEDAARGIGRGYELRATDITTAMGRKTKAGSPIAASVMDASRAIMRAEKARVDRAIWNFANSEGGSAFMRPYDPENPPRQVMGRKIGPDGKVKDVVDPVKVQEMTINLMVDGETRRVFVPDKLLRDQIRKVATADDPGPVLRAIGKATGMVGRLLTEFNPNFTIPNATRDAITVAIRAKAHGVNPGEVTAQIPVAWKAIADYKRGADTELARQYEEFLREGGKTGAYGIRGVIDTMADLEKAGAELGYDQYKAPSWRKVARHLGKVANAVSSANEVVEYGARFALYRKLRENGVSAKEAAAAAKEVTVNFNRSGEYGRAMNSLLVFANAALQGLYGTIKYMKNPSVRRGMMGLVALGAATQMFNELLGGENEETGEANINSQSDAVADKNLVLLLPGTRSGVKIPLPPEYSFLYGIGRRLWRLFSQGDVEREAAGIVANILDSTLPVRIPDADSAPLAAAKAVTPTLAAPFVDIWTNQNYFGSPIVPERGFDQSPPPYFTISRQQTSELAKAVSELLNTATGGDEIEPGKSQKWLGPLVSPEGIEHLVSFYTGGLGQFTMQMTNLAKPEKRELNRTPIVSRFVFTEPQGYIGRRYREITPELQYAKDRLRVGQEIPEKLDRALPEFEAAERELRRLYREMRERAQEGDTVGVEQARAEIKAAQSRVIRAYNGQPLQ